MKRYVLLLLSLAATAAANTPPEVTHLYAQQRPNSQLVDITYSVVDPDQDPLTISVSLYNGSGVMIMQCVSLSGAVGAGILPGTNKHITWDAGADFSGQFGSDYTLRVVANDGVDFVAIAPGTFMMGSPTTEPMRSTYEPQHQVTLTHSIYVQTTEVTNQQYRDMAQWAYNNGYVTATSADIRDNLDGSSTILKTLGAAWYEISFSAGVFSCINPTHPVKYVTWYGAAAYCDWLSLQQNLPRAYNHSTWRCNAGNPYGAVGYRLPTEAEWEYACRAGTQTPFNTGACLDVGTEANYEGRYFYYEPNYPGCPFGPSVGATVPVGSYPANAFGLFDMHGNLQEWCNDGNGPYGGTVTDPVGNVAGSYLVFRGGSWISHAQNCRSAVRASTLPYFSDPYVGFRPVRSVL